MSAKLIGLVAHPEKKGAAALVRALRDDFTRRGAEVRMEPAAAALIGAYGAVAVEQLAVDCEIIVVLGGDGTILNLVHDLGGCCPQPLFGINLGSLGFLTCLSSADYRLAVDCILNGSYLLSQRSLLAVEVIRNGASLSRYFGLNDAVISRGALSRLIRLETRINGTLLTEYNADGLIVATPTGSTAYSLSAGGPLLTPDANVFAITPICPHTLTNRSVIIGDQACVEVRLGNPRADFFLTVDGQRAIALQAGDSVCIRRAAHTLALAMLPDLPFFELTRRKLKWSGSNL
jgi:NAD+ kinase